MLQRHLIPEALHLLTGFLETDNETEKMTERSMDTPDVSPG
jgi:hypothetical protein